MISTVKVKNYFKVRPAIVQIYIKNIRVNSELRGCSGFIQFKNTIVYINTEPSCMGKTLLWRYAENLQDYTGGQNHLVNEDVFLSQVLSALTA